MSADWRAVGEFVLLKKDNVVNDLGLIVDTNYFEAPLADIYHTQVEQTWLAGKLKYQQK